MAIVYRDIPCTDGTLVSGMVKRLFGRGKSSCFMYSFANGQTNMCISLFILVELRDRLARLETTIRDRESTWLLYDNP